MNENRLEVLIALCGFALGAITIYGPTWLFLRHERPIDRRDFALAFPQKNRWLTLYEAGAFLGLLAAPVLFIFIFRGLDSNYPFLFLCFISNGIGIINGIFEALTGICPRRGMYLRRSVGSIYVPPSPVRKTGIVRICLGLALIGLVYGIAMV
ncbi:MAG: hypothetical protein JXA21_01870 [Anaerolineae bacterium]|nr:hypothetical protein [Anaerolineae bacterium]